MGAVPKYRISSIKRGQRRAGQLKQMKLKKDPNQESAPKHKRGLVAAMFSQMNIDFKKIISR